MVEEAEGPDCGSANNGAGAAMALGLGSGSQDQANAFLEEQTRLARLQAHELGHELSLRRWSLWVRHVSGVLKLAFEFSIALVLLGVVALLANEVWAAAHDNGLVIEPFSVPPDLAARGLTGQVVATQMLDNLSALDSQINSSRAPSSYANNWGDDIKVEIPETGVSIGQLNTYLHQLLGHQTHITGEVVRTASGIAITARAGIAGKRFSGPESDFDNLLLQATEAVYASTQPYRYSVHLQSLGQMAQAEAFLTASVRTLPLSERIWAYAGLTNYYLSQHRMAEDVEATRESVRLKPDFAWGWGKVAGAARQLGQAEAELAANRTTLEMLNGPGAADLRPDAIQSLRKSTNSAIDELLGDYAGATREVLARYPSLADIDDGEKQVQGLLAVPGQNLASIISVPAVYAADLISIHDLAAVERRLAGASSFLTAIGNATVARNDARGKANTDGTLHVFGGVEMRLALAHRDWAGAARDAAALDAQEAGLNAAYASTSLYPPTTIWPIRALAEAKMGNFAAAHAWIDKTPGDCDLCLRTRGQIDAAQKNYGGADFWFARAARLAPSIPFAYADWGAALLARGDPAGAIAKFKIANQKGPHFADPLEGWGEALMAQNRSDLGIAKFAQAEAFAPNWSLLHRKWGEALVYAGKKDEAQKQFALADALDRPHAAGP